MSLSLLEGRMPALSCSAGFGRVRLHFIAQHLHQFAIADSCLTARVNSRTQGFARQRAPVGSSAIIAARGYEGSQALPAKGDALALQLLIRSLDRDEADQK